MQREVRLAWTLIARVNAGKIRELPRPRFFIQAFRISLLADGAGAIQEDLEEIDPARRGDLAGSPAILFARANQRHDGYETRPRQKSGNLGHPPPILGTVCRRKAQVGV